MGLVAGRKALRASGFWGVVVAGENQHRQVIAQFRKGWAGTCGAAFMAARAGQIKKNGGLSPPQRAARRGGLNNDGVNSPLQAARKCRAQIMSG